MKIQVTFSRMALAAILFIFGASAPGFAKSLKQAPAISALDCAPGAPCAAKLPVKVVIVTLFEIGADTGDRPAEFQFWKERRKLDTKIAFPQSFHDLWYNPDSQILGVVTGIGTANSTAAIMALGLDPRFDLSKTYWLVAGIAGIDPEDAPIGSAAWARFIVDGDLAHEIDEREIPKSWSTGYFPRGGKFPYDPAGLLRKSGEGNVFEANAKLRAWAYDLTKDVKIPNPPELDSVRKQFADFPNAQKPPFVLKGDTLSASTFWHGKRMNEWANKWTKYWSRDQGEFVTSAMEDTGVMQSLTYLSKIDKVDLNRVMVLRAGSNYTMQPKGQTAVEHLLGENDGYSGMLVSLEALYAVGSVVVDELIGKWDLYEKKSPGDPS